MLTENWHETYANVVTLCRYLVDEQDYNARELLDVLAAPWKFSAEFYVAVLKAAAP